MAVSDDDVRVIPVPTAALGHIPNPHTTRKVRLLLGYICNAKLVRGRDDLQIGSLLSWSQFTLLDSHLIERARIDVGVIEIPRLPAQVLVLVESVD